MDTIWENAAETLERDGIVAAPQLFSEEADYLRAAFIEESTSPRLPAGRGVKNVDEARGIATGNLAWKYISLTDPVLSDLILNPNLLGLVDRYYGTQPYIRRMPQVKRTSVKPHHQADISGVYHIDQGKHFVGLMMLLSDLTEQQSHMRYLLGTHRFEHTSFRLKADDPRLKEIERELENQYPVFRLVGPKGTMFIYDNGNGIHKGNMIAGTTRDVMHATFSRGDHTAKPTDMDLMPDELRAAVAAGPAIVQNAIMKIV